jgi:hypothetical protein
MDDAESQQAINEFERRLISGNDMAEGRLALRHYLFGLADTPVSGSVGDAVAILASLAHPPASAAAVVLRAIAHSELVRDNIGNNLNRHVVELAEKALPGLCSLLGVEPKSQTYEKFELLRGALPWVERQLILLKTPYTTTDSLLAARGPLFAALAHGRLTDFGAVYHLPEVKDAIESLFATLSQVARIESTLAADVQTCTRVITDARRLALDFPSFLTIGYIEPFLDSALRCLKTFLESLRGRFTAGIVQGWVGQNLLKQYPLSEANRDLRVLVPFSNTGPGAAADVHVIITSFSEHVLFLNERISLGNISPGQFSVALEVHIVDPCPDFVAMVELQWGEIGSAVRQEAIFELCVRAQSSDIDWEAQTYADPYGTSPAEGDAFIGRREQIQTLVARMLRTPMEPSYITGQKRVGKTSLATAAAEQARTRDPKSKLVWTYILWGQIAHEDPRVSLRQLGEEIEEFILGQLPTGAILAKGNYDGSLSGLMKLSAAFRSIDPDRRFIVIIDEFDEMPQELYIQGNLAETLFGNIRAITTTNNICILLVGGENMPFVMDRQGQKLNKFSRVNLNYFSRATEWDDYTQLIRQPAAGVLEWHPDAVSEVYDLTNGNPYFSKIICSKVFARALRERDADVTREDVRDVVDAEVTRFDDNLFAHLWQDGIFAPTSEREPIVLKRKRVLAAIARCIRDGQATTLPNIYAKKGTAELANGELASVLNDFVSRGVLIEEGGIYQVALPIFRLWLIDIGLTRLASDALSEDLAFEVQRSEDEARVLSDELVALTGTWPTYRGRHIGADDVRAWLNQRSGNRDQRLLFTMLKALRFISEAEVLERIRGAKLVVLGVAEVAVRRRTAERRNDIVITYVDGEGKSGQKYSAMYAEENLIASTSILPPSSFRISYEAHVAKFGVPKVIVILDDIVGTGKSLSTNLKNFTDENLDVFTLEGPSILAFALWSTLEGQQQVMNSLNKLEYTKIDFRAGEIFGDDAFAFLGKQGVFATGDDRDRARSVATDIGATIYRRAPLGFGGQGLLVVFPTTVPNNSVPLLHSGGKGPAPQWRPLFPRLVN